MGPYEIAKFLPILDNEVDDAFSHARDLDRRDGERALAELVASMLAEHVRNNQTYYEQIRPLDEDSVASEAAAR